MVDSVHGGNISNHMAYTRINKQLNSKATEKLTKA